MLSKQLISLICTFFTFGSMMLNGQHNIIQNGSFEDNVSVGNFITDFYPWINMVNDHKSPPDIHCNETRNYGAANVASEGKYYLGMVARIDGSFEKIGQNLAYSLEPGKTYKIQLDLAKSEYYFTHPIEKMYEFGLYKLKGKQLHKRIKELSAELVSGDRDSIDVNIVNLEHPLSLSVVVGLDMDISENVKLNDSIVVFETTAITHNVWERYSQTFTVPEPMNFIIIKMEFCEDEFYWGNMIIDNIRLYEIKK